MASGLPTTMREFVNIKGAEDESRWEKFGKQFLKITIDFSRRANERIAGTSTNQTVFYDVSNDNSHTRPKKPPLRARNIKPYKGVHSMNSKR